MPIMLSADPEDKHFFESDLLQAIKDECFFPDPDYPMILCVKFCSYTRKSNLHGTWKKSGRPCNELMETFTRCMEKAGYKNALQSVACQRVQKEWSGSRGVAVIFEPLYEDKADEVRFIKGRLRFETGGNPKTQLPFLQ